LDDDELHVEAIDDEWLGVRLQVIDDDRTRDLEDADFVIVRSATSVSTLLTGSRVGLTARSCRSSMLSTAG